MDLLAAHHHEDHLPVLIGIHALALDVGAAAVHILDDEIAQFGMVILTDDEKQFVVRRAVDHIGQHARRNVDRDERVERQQPAAPLDRLAVGAASHAETDDQKSRQHDARIGEQDARREFHLGEFLQIHGDDVRTACRSLIAQHQPHSQTDEHGSQQRREHQVVRQVDHTAEELLGIERFERLLVGKGDPREQVYQTRREAGGEERAAAELPAENDDGARQQRNVDHIAERTDLNRGKDVVQDDAHAVHAAGNDVVRADEIGVPYRHDQTPQYDGEHRTPPREGSDRFEKRFQIHTHASF